MDDLSVTLNKVKDFPWRHPLFFINVTFIYNLVRLTGETSCDFIDYQGDSLMVTSPGCTFFPPYFLVMKSIIIT